MMNDWLYYRDTLEVTNNLLCDS